MDEELTEEQMKEQAKLNGMSLEEFKEEYAK